VVAVFVEAGVVVTEIPAAVPAGVVMIESVESFVELGMVVVIMLLMASSRTTVNAIPTASKSICMRANATADSTTQASSKHFPLGSVRFTGLFLEYA
jgi:hypothetical protein